LFDRLGIRESIDRAGFLRATGNTVQWADQEKRIERFDGDRYGYQVPRNRFDSLMLDAAHHAGVTVFENAVVRDVARAGDEWQVSYDQTVANAQSPAEARGTWLLDCSGRSGVVARRGWRRSEHAARTTAVVGVWENTGGWSIEDETHTLVESYGGGWSWSVPVSATRRYVTVMLDPTTTELPARTQLGEAYQSELGRTRMLRDLVASATLIEPPWGCDASPYSAHRVTEDRVLLVGDAASFVDPLSSFGVKKALASAWLASVAVHTSLLDSGMAAAALALFAEREGAMYEHLQRQSARLAREAAGAHETEFWRGRADTPFDEPEDDIDLAAVRADPRVLGAFEQLKAQAFVKLRPSGALQVVERATVRGGRVVLDTHLIAQRVPRSVRYFRNVDLVVMVQLAPRYDQVPDLYDAYNRAAPPAPLPDFLAALSTMIALDMLSLA
jgi:flavin-dependent dehydrogenase